MVFIITPPIGITKITFGMTQKDVSQSMKISSNQYKQFDGTVVDAFYNSTLQVFYDNKGLVNYIEFSNDNKITPQFDSIDIFHTKASNVIDLLKSKYQYNENDPELGYSYVFPDIELSLWREDKNKEFFDTVGIGVKGYYSNE